MSLIRETKVRRRRERTRRILIYGGIVVVLAAFLASGLYLLPQLRITEVSISGNKTIEAGDIASTLRSSISGTFFFLFPRNAYALVRERKIQEMLTEAFPIFAEVSVDKTFPRSLAVMVREREPYAIWCVEETYAEAESVATEEEIGSTCFYIDTDGVAFTRAPDVSGNLITKIVDRRRAAPLLGEGVLERDVTHSFNLLTEEFERVTKVRPRKIVIGAEHPKSVQVVTGEGWVVQLETDTDIKTALENLRLIIERDIKNTQNLEYIDLRFADKVFYKLK